jgi:hypothetical protein
MKMYEVGSKSVKIPMSNVVNLRMEVPNDNNESLLPVTGKFRYICDRTRPDILVSVGEISTGGAKSPSDMHIKVSKQIFNFLKQTIEKALYLGGKGELLHFGFSDAAYITAGTSKSRLGHCQFLGKDSGAINCTSVNDTTVSHSSMESEIKSLDHLILGVIYTRNVLKFLGYELTNPTIIFGDNKSAIELCKTLKQTKRSRHIQMKINFIRECINDKIIELIFIPTEYNVADTLTKPLSVEKFNKHSDKLLNGFNGNIDYLFDKTIAVNYTAINEFIDMKSRVKVNKN